MVQSGKEMRKLAGFGLPLICDSTSITSSFCMMKNLSAATLATRTANAEQLLQLHNCKAAT